LKAFENYSLCSYCGSKLSLNIGLIVCLIFMFILGFKLVLFVFP